MKVKVWNCDYIPGIVYKGQDTNYTAITRLQLKKTSADNTLQTRLGYRNLNGRAAGHKLLVVCDSCHMKVVLLIRMEILFIWKIYHEPHIRIAAADPCNSEMKATY